jgi:hypothetical protein
MISLLVLAGCNGDEKKQGLTPSEGVFVPPAMIAVTVEPGVRFVDVTEQSGIDFKHVSGAYGDKLLPETMGSGVGIFDWDDDGRLDLLFVQSRYWEDHTHGATQPTMRLYRNLGNWRFLDVTKRAGLDRFVCYGMGCAIADYDADGDQDVYITCLGENLLLRCDNGRYEKVQNGPGGGTWTDAKGVTHPSWSTGAAWFDADSDGDLDLVVVSYVQWTVETDVYATQTGDEKAYTRPQLYPGDYPRLYLQEEGTFRDATKGSGFDKPGDPGKSMAVCLDDFDGDERLDVFVSNDTVQNYLFLATGPATFRECAVEAAVAYDDRGQARAGMGIDAVDWRNDGRIAVLIGNFSEEPVSVYTFKHLTAGTPVFKDDAAGARIGRPTLLPLSFGLAMFDADLDGWCDLMLANGHIEPTVSKIKKEIQYAQPPQLFRNVEGKRFADVSVDAGAPFLETIVGRGLAYGDLDGDGDLDVVLTSNGAQDAYRRPLILRNDVQTKNRSLRLRLHQDGKNRHAVGAIVRVTVGGTTQRRVVRTGGTYLSQSELTLTFGLGAADTADKIVVQWPDGTERDFGARDAGAHTLSR